MTREPDQRWDMTRVRDFLDQSRDVPVHPEPLAPSDSQSTQVLEPTPAQPMAVPPIVADPALVAPPPAVALAPAPRGGQRRRRAVWPWVAAVVALVAVVVIGFAALNADHGGGKKNAAAGGPTSSSPVTRSSGSTTTGAPQAAAMQSFITTYFSTVTSDDHATFDMLTPAFQAQSHGYGGYHGFWKTIASATPSNIVADPASMTVSYDIAYVKADGTHSTDHRTLRLVRSGSSYLIDGES